MAHKKIKKNQPLFEEKKYERLHGNADKLFTGLYFGSVEMCVLFSFATLFSISIALQNLYICTLTQTHHHPLPYYACVYSGVVVVT